MAASPYSARHVQRSTRTGAGVTAGHNRAIGASSTTGGVAVVSAGPGSGPGVGRSVGVGSTAGVGRHGSGVYGGESGDCHAPTG